jgi:hypothetical protein
MTLPAFLLFVVALAQPLTLSQVWTLDGAYNDPQNGVSFHYPRTWQPETGFAQQQPLLNQSEAKPVAGFGYSEGGFPRSRVVGPYSATNLEGVGVVYSVVPAAGAAACEKKAAAVSGSSKGPRVDFGGRLFSVYATAEAGMSQSLTGKLYATYSGAHCYLFETDVAVVSPGVVDGVTVLTPSQQQAIDAGLAAIMQSVRIAAN